MSSAPDVTELLVAWSNGDDRALDSLAPLVHDELHRLAARYMAGESPGHILQTTALVNEAYLRLIDWNRVEWQSINVWIQRLDDGARLQVTLDRKAMSFPRWSLDGRWLAVTIKRGDRTHVGIVAAEGGETEQVTFDRGQSWPYSCSPDGEQIAFAGERQGVWNIYAVSRRTGRVTH